MEVTFKTLPLLESLLVIIMKVSDISTVKISVSVRLVIYSTFECGPSVKIASPFFRPYALSIMFTSVFLPFVYVSTSTDSFRMLSSVIVLWVCCKSLTLHVNFTEKACVDHHLGNQWHLAANIFCKRCSDWSDYVGLLLGNFWHECMGLRCFSH